MQKITTYNGIKLLLVEIPKDAMGIELISRLKSVIINEEHNDLWYYTKTSDDMIFVELPKNYYELIGTTSTLTDEQVKELIKYFTFTKGVSGDNWYKCDTLNEFLEVNNIDTSKEYVILKLLNNE
jgi:hypothetical protein